MKRILSLILTIAIILSLGATVSAKMGENSTNMNTFKPTGDPIYWYEQPRNEDGSYDYFGYPLYGDPQDVPDEEFFGSWNLMIPEDLEPGEYEVQLGFPTGLAQRPTLMLAIENEQDE